MEYKATPPPIVILANRRFSRIFFKIGALLFAGALLLPYDWQQILGILAEPVVWVAAHVPSIGKVAAVSPIAELVRGFFGIAFLLTPLFYIFIIWQDPIDLRFEYGLRQAKSPFKFFGLVYFLIVPALLLLLYLILFWPGEVRLDATSTRGQMLLVLMISYRFTLALNGSLLILGFCAFLWLITIFLVGPIQYLCKRTKHHVK